jgi:hypothetical protein
MGIRFTCHHCSYAMHVKDFQAGKRGKCPHCNKSFRIPVESTDYSIPILDGKSESMADAPARSTAVISRSVAKETHATSQSEPSDQTQSPVASSAKPQSDKRSSRPSGTNTSNPQNIPNAFASAPNAAWYVRPPSGGQYGPADQQLLQLWILENRVTGDSLLWREGQTQWIPSATLLPELYSSESLSQSDAPANHPTSNEPTKTKPDTSFTIARPTTTVSSASTANLAAQRKIRKRRQQWIAISILAIVSLGLCVGLIAVLFLK